MYFGRRRLIRTVVGRDIMNVPEAKAAAKSSQVIAKPGTTGRVTEYFGISAAEYHVVGEEGGTKVRHRSRHRTTPQAIA